MHIGRDHAALELFHARQQFFCDPDCICTRFFGNCQRYRGEFTLGLDLLVGRRRASSQPHITAGLIGAIPYFGDITQKHRLAV